MNQQIKYTIFYTLSIGVFHYHGGKGLQLSLGIVFLDNLVSIVASSL